MPIRCIIVDDHALFRAGLRRLLDSEDDFNVIAEASDATAAIDGARLHRPDIVLLDIGMPGMSSFEAARLITAEHPGTRVIFLTMFEDEEYLLRGLETGASGYLLKDSPASELLHALREVHSGKRYLSPELLAKVEEVSRNDEKDGADRAADLTPREMEVIKALAEGCSVRQVASRLGVTAKTVEAHKFNLMRKLDIHNKAQLVTYAIQKKILKIPANL